MNTQRKPLKYAANLAYMIGAALMIAAMLLNLFPVTPALASKKADDLQLNLSHIECVDGQVEIHFVLLNVPDRVTPGTLTYTYGTISPGPHTGNIWHFYDYKPSGYYNVTSASVTVGSKTVSLHNPGDYADTYNCGSLPPSATATVTVGDCSWDEDTGSTTEVVLTLVGASLTINGNTYTSSTTINLPPGVYSYTWTAQSGYTGSGSGEITVGSCEPGEASASLNVVECLMTETGYSNSLVAITLVGASLTINGNTYTSSTTINLPPGVYPYTWTAQSGYTGSGSGVLKVSECGLPEVEASLDCYTLEEHAFAVIITNTSFTGIIGYSTDADSTIVSLGTLEYWGTTTIYVPAGASVVNFYAQTDDGWKSIGQLFLNTDSAPLCEEGDPLALESFCSYVDLDLPIGWTVTNLNPFSISFTWAYGSESSAAPIPLGPGESTSFSTTDQGDEEMLVFVDGFLLASLLGPESCPAFETLEIAGICSAEPATSHGWTVTNFNDFDVDAEWKIIGDSLLTGLLTIPANSSLSFTTPVSEGNIVAVYYNGEIQSSDDAATGCTAGEVPPDDTPDGNPPPPRVNLQQPVLIPITGGEQPVLIPVTGVANDVSSTPKLGMFGLGIILSGIGLVLQGLSRRRSEA